MKHSTYRKLTGIALSLLVAGPQVFAQTNRNLTLNEAVELSIKHSGQLKLANARVDEANASYHEAWNNHLPDLKVTGSYMRLNSPDVSMKIQLGGTSAKTGGDTTRSGTSTITVNQVAYAMASASLPLFSGFRIKYGVESARYLEQAAKLDAEHDREQVIQNTVDAYNNLYKAKRSVDLVKENLVREKQRVADFTNLERNGLLARNDLLKAQLQVSNVELALLDAENNYKITTMNMSLLLGLPENLLLIPDSTAFSSIPDAGAIIQWEQSALDNRKDAASLSYKEKAAATAIKITKGDYYPSVALTGGTIALDVPNLLMVTNALNAGIGLQYNLGSLWKTQAKIAQANARLHQIQATEGILHDRIRLEINHAYETYLLSVRKIDVYAKALEQADENYRIVKNKYDNALATTTDLLDADVADLQAKMNYAFAKGDAVVAYKKLQQTAGVLSENPSTK